MIDVTKYIGGLMIADAAQLAINEAARKKERVKFTFNEIELEVDPKSYVGDICWIYSLKHYINRLKLGYE